MTFGSLFAGIGGMDLGLERAGLECQWQVEIDEYARRVLARHWPHVRRWDDVRTFPPPEGGWSVDLICGGFPCQDISDAGLRIGIDGERSGLWSQFIRVVRAIRPQYVLVENTTGLLARGMGTVLGDLSESGFDAEWACVSASQFGAYHIRQRVFILAYPRRERCLEAQVLDQATLPPVPPKASGPDPEQIWMPGVDRRIGRSGRTLLDPELDRVADGFPTVMDKLRVKCGGNAVVPQVAERIGRQLMRQLEG